MKGYKEKAKQLEALMATYTQKDILLAFSGGVDSSLILKVACECACKTGKKVYALTLHTMLHPMREIEEAKSVADEVGAIHLVMQVDELQATGILNNPIDRCYLCKKYLFTQMLKKAEELHVETILEGTNIDDLQAYRPGIKALEELGILSPFILVGMTKVEIRQMAEAYGISTAQKPSMPCLATRFPYGTQLSYEKMQTVAQGEAFIKGFGVYNVRLRVHEDIARIEVDEQDIEKVLVNKTAIINTLKRLGYSYITIDLEGFRSGSMDYKLTSKVKG